MYRIGFMASLNDTTMTIRVNSETKKKAQELFAEIGLDMSSAINIFLKRAILEEGIPFEVGKNVKSARDEERGDKL